MFGFDDRKKVDLRGKSKKEDRNAVVARAAREREERQRQREKQKAVLCLQSTYRARLDLRRMRTALRAHFDAAIAPLDATSFGPQAAALTRDLLIFHQHCEPSDGGRRRELLLRLLQSAERPDAACNACVHTCGGDGGLSRWRYQMQRLVEMCLPHLLLVETKPPVPAPQQSVPTLELRAAGYLLDAAAWHWASLLPPASAAALPGVAASLAVSLGGRGLYAHVSASLRRLLPAARGSAPPALVAPLLALTVRGLHAACGSGSTEAALAFARGCLCEPGVLVHVPAPLLAVLFGPAIQPLVGALAPLAPQLQQLLAAAPSRALQPPPAVGASASLAAAEVTSLLSHAELCANLVHLVRSCAGSAAALGLGEALPGYVRLLAASHAATSFVLANRRPAVGRLGGGAASSLSAGGSGGGGANGGLGGGGGAAASGGGDADESDGEPMEGDAGAAAAATGAAEAEAEAVALRPEHQAAIDSLACRLGGMAAPDHMASLWRAILAPAAPPAFRGCASQLASVFCALLYGGGGGGGGGAARRSAERLPEAAAALSAVAFLHEGGSSHEGGWDAVGQLWGVARQLSSDWRGAEGGALLCVFCACFSHLLIAVDDREFFDGERPFSAAALRPMVGALKAAALAAYWPPPGHSACSASAPPAALSSVVLRLLRQLYDRDARRSYMGGAHTWFAEPARQQTIEALAQRMDPSALVAVQAEDGGGGGDGEEGVATDGAVGSSGLALSEMSEARRVASVLLRMPFTLAFESRLRVLRRWLGADREERLASILMGQMPHTITVRREHLLRDALSQLRGYGLQLRSPLRVTFLGIDGLEEAGIGEGVAKEFLVDVLKAGFDPALGLFTSTPDGLLYPNPAAALRVDDAYALFEFLGAILAKVLYEGILVELPLAPFFTSKLLGRTNTVAELPSLDRRLFDSLMFLKQYDGDLEALALTFAVEQYTDETLPAAARRTVALKPLGADIPVSAANRLEYVFLVAHYRLNTQMRRPCDTFLRGFSEVVPSSWVGMFSPSELQLVLGGSDAPLDVDDWEANTSYSGGYHARHPVIMWLWTVLREYDATRRAATLKFVTSCSRPPLLGFSYLQPGFCVHRASDEEGRLPTAATCMNLMKLPPYESLDILRERLTYAIEAGCGFELS